MKAFGLCNLTSIKPPEVSKSYTIVGVSILSHIHPGADAAKGICDTNAHRAHNDGSISRNKCLFPNVLTNGWLAKRC